MEPLDTFRSHLPEWTLAYAALEDGLLGFCDLERQTIWVDVNLDERTQRATIMHEVIHALRRDVHDLDPVAEHEVEVQTARRLVPAPALRAAIAASSHPEDIADVLGVDFDLLRTRLRNLDRDEMSLLRRAVLKNLPRDPDSAASEHCALGRWWLQHEQPGQLPCHGRCPTRRTVGRADTPASSRLPLHVVPDLEPGTDPALAEPAV